MTDRLRLSGRLDLEGNLTLRPVFPTIIPPEPWPDGPMFHVAETLDDQGRTLTRDPLTARTNCETGGRSLRGSIDVPEEAVRLHVLRVDASGRDPLRLASAEISTRPPQVRLVNAPEGLVDGEFTITWESDGEPGNTTYFVDYSHGQDSWSPLAFGQAEPFLAVDFDTCAGGDFCRVSVVASSGLRASRAVSEPFQVRTKPCAAVIQRPTDDQEIPQETQLVGNGWWREENRPELAALIWTSDVDGDLGRGSQLTTRLTPGTHQITLRAGVGERTGETSVTVRVTEDGA